MKLAWERKLEELRVELLDPAASGPDPVYRIYKDLEMDGWVNRTVISAGRIGAEYPKTFGHYHGVEVLEKYQVAGGEGVLMLQKKHLELGFWTPEKVDEVLLIKVSSRDEIVIPPDYGHLWSNVGESPLILYDNWKVEHSPTDYADIKRLHGLAYYLVEENGAIRFVANPNYLDLPEPVWLSVEEYGRYRDGKNGH